MPLSSSSSRDGPSGGLWDWLSTPSGYALTQGLEGRQGSAHPRAQPGGLRDGQELQNNILTQLPKEVVERVAPELLRRHCEERGLQPGQFGARIRISTLEAVCALVT